MDARNTLIQHLIVGAFSLVLVFVFHYLLEIQWSTAFARVSFILLSLVLLIGPVMKLTKPIKASSPLEIPWTWRGELGIWFALTGLVHFIFVISGRSFSDLIKIGGSGFSLANLLGLIALIISLLLTATSFRKIILFLGIESWKWLHSLTYVVFYLVSAHFIYFQFFSTYGQAGPDWFGYFALTLAVMIVILQFSAFARTLIKNKSKKGFQPQK